jgi:tetratricopeptide (TPR) repeat protein
MLSKGNRNKTDYHKAFNNMGNAYNDKGENDKAIECYQKAIAIKPDHEAFNNMGNAYDDKGENDKAMRMLIKRQ